MKEITVNGISVIENVRAENAAVPAYLCAEAAGNVRRIHESVRGYAPTPLVRLDAMAERTGVKAVLVKDESKRFGLNAFKGLGGTYAIFRIAARECGLDPDKATFGDLKRPEYADRISRMVFVTATDGNHGRGVSWAAGLLGCEAHVYMPAGSAEKRAQAIRDVNPRAECVITDMDYDDAVRHAAGLAKKNGWYLVQDTSFEGYEEIPAWIMQGYTTMAAEACDDMDRQGLIPTHVLLQAGVGSMAAAVAAYIIGRYGERRPYIGVVEPTGMACFYRSAQCGDGAPHAAVDRAPTMMAGLNCGEPCPPAWEILRDHADMFVKCPDGVSALGMRALAMPRGNDMPVVSGESAAVTCGLVNAAAEPGNRELKKALKLDEDTVVLLFSTEGDTDPDNYRRVVRNGEMMCGKTAMME